MSKELCHCGKIATWVYMPGYSEGGSPYSCDDCVHRGCSCNYRYMLHDNAAPSGVEGVNYKWVEDDVRPLKLMKRLLNSQRNNCQ